MSTLATLVAAVIGAALTWIYETYRKRRDQSTEANNEVLKRHGEAHQAAADSYRDLRSGGRVLRLPERGKAREVRRRTS